MPKLLPTYQTSAICEYSLGFLTSASYTGCDRCVVSRDPDRADDDPDAPEIFQYVPGID